MNRMPDFLRRVVIAASLRNTREVVRRRVRRGGATANIDIYRDGAVIATVANTGVYTDSLGMRGGNVRTPTRCAKRPPRTAPMK
jgi:hypothetical protein